MQPRRLNGVLFLCALLVAWEIVAQAQWINPLIVPPLSRILRIFWEQVSSGQIPAQILVSMKRAAAGYFLAAAVFIPLGIFMGLSQRIYSLFEVIVEMLRPVPPPVLIPLAMLFFGLEDKMKIFRNLFFLRLADPAQYARRRAQHRPGAGEHRPDVRLVAPENPMANRSSRRRAAGDDRHARELADHADPRRDFRNGRQHGRHWLLYSRRAAKV